MPKIKKNKLVSIISPCYNGESFVARFIESILKQTYDNIEFIIVNDGSTDRTEEIILSYRESFIKKGYGFVYIKQENAGASAALNRALKCFSGDFLSWPDSDDFLPSDAISKQVHFLEEHPSYGLVKGVTEVVEDYTFAHKAYLRYKKTQKVNEFFFVLLKHFIPGGYLVRSDFFRDSMPKPLVIQAPREIGQNYQLLLPVSYKYPCGFIDDICYVYTIRLSSHSHIRHTFEEKIQICEISYQVLINIAKDMGVKGSERVAIDKAILVYKLINVLSAMFDYRCRNNLDEIISELKNIGEYENRAKRIALCIKFPLFGYVYRVYRKLLRISISFIKMIM